MHVFLFIFFFPLNLICIVFIVYSNLPYFPFMCPEIQSASKISPRMFEPWYNSALVAFRLGDCQESFECAKKAIDLVPDHHDCNDLLKQLQKHFSML